MQHSGAKGWIGLDGMDGSLSSLLKSALEMHVASQIFSGGMY